MTDLIPNDLNHMSDKDFNALCPQGHHGPGAEPLSLKQQALEALQRAEEGWRPIPDDCNIIRRALETLPNDC